MKKYKKNNLFLNKTLLISILLCILFCENIQKISFSNKNYYSYNQLNSTKNINIINMSYLNNNITNKETLLAELIKYSNKTKQSNIIFADWYQGKTCCDKNAFTLFDYYLKNNIDESYYIINSESNLYKFLLKSNRTSNLILYNEKNKTGFYKDLFKYLINTKIIVTAYSTPLLQLFASYVPHIKYLKINHGIKHFKLSFAKTEFLKSLGNKMNVICSSPYEYKLLRKDLNYSIDKIHNASLARYERFQFLKKNESEKKCILASFTWRAYNKNVFQNSEYKKNLEKILNDKELIFFLKKRNIDLIYIPHHQEVIRGKNYSQNNYQYARIKNQIDLEFYIEQCSLLITDFSSICFDFMFQNKPVLFFKIDKNDFVKNNHYDELYFGNYFYKRNFLIDKIKHYVNNSFRISKDLKQKYESVFFYKNHIIEKIIEIINNIVKGKKSDIS